VTEAEWLACRVPQTMLEFLGDKVSARKVRLFACTCCRRIWQLLSDERSRVAVEAAERYAEGLASLPELTGAIEAASAAYRDGSDAFYGFRTDIPRPHSVAPHGSAIHAAYINTLFPPYMDAYMAANSAAYAVFKPPSFPFDHADADAIVVRERAAQAPLLRDIFGPLPFRPSTVDPAWLTWNGGTVRHLAQAAYEERHLPTGELDLSRLAVLADALEEAGCADVAILTHLRGQGPLHVRGCWAVDLLLAKG